jgi:CelD/BcsL family acetyltransferase involved in cellulose biosynthesis
MGAERGMQIECLPAHKLSSDLVACWDKIALSLPEFASPYFRPEFTQAVAAVRNNVEVGILRDGDTIVGIFPFERVGGCVARPVGGRLSDYQAVITRPEEPWRVEDLMCGCRLRAWEFDHQLASQGQLKPHVVSVANSWRIDVSAGFDALVAGRKAAGAGALSEMLRKSRKLQRERDIRFEWHVTDEAAFNQLLAWKSDQYRRSELTDLFAFP